MRKKSFFFLLLATMMFNASIAQVKYKEKIKNHTKLIEYEEHQLLDSLNAILIKHFNKNGNLEWEISKINNYVEKIDRYKNGKKLEFSNISIIKSNDKIKSIEGVCDVKISSSQILISEEEAINYAKDYFGNSEFTNEDETRSTISLVYIPMKENGKLSNKYRISYKINLYGIKPLRREWVYIDASNGQVLFTNSIIHQPQNFIDPDYPYDFPPLPPDPTPTHQTGTANTFYSGVRQIETYELGGIYYHKNLYKANGIYVYDMLEGIKYSSAILRTDNDNIWNSTSTASLIGNEAFWAQCLVYDYFLNKHNRQSIDDNGFILKGYYNTNLVSLGYTDNDNAFWDGSKMTYGLGTRFYSLVTLDIVAHEIAHGLDDFTSELIYERESGAINESLSDIWACIIESEYAPEKSRYLIGEDLNNIGLRSMINPRVWLDPMYYQGQNWRITDCGTPTRYNDYCGVHSNCSVMNYWFYLLSNGDSGVNEAELNFNISGIGIEKAAKIIYRTQTNYLNSTSDFDDMRRYSIYAANKLYGEHSFESIEVMRAWEAVGLDSDFSSYITGPTKATNSGNYTWSAGVNYGIAPFTYRWYRRYNGGSYTLASTNSSYTCNMPYNYDLELKLDVTDSDGNTSTNNKMILNLDAGRGGKPLPYISISPNPVKNKELNIKSDKSYEKDSYIIISDNSGLRLYTFDKVKIKKDNTLTFNVNKLSYGTYILKIVFPDGETYSTHFVVK